MNKIAILGPVVFLTLAFTIPQVVNAQAESSQEITVIAPQVSVQKQESEDSGFAKVLVITTTRKVSFADLDLRSANGVEMLKERLRAAAKEGCEQISEEHPLVKDDSCVRIALANANAQAERVIEAAGSQ